MRPGYTVAFLVAAFATSVVVAQEKILPLDGEVFSVSGHTAFVILPKGVDSESSIPWVWYAPTLTGLPGSEERWMLEHFTSAGFAIAGIDVGESYGSPDGVKLYSALYDELIGKRGFAPKATLLARSRGGLMLLNWAAHHPEKVACIAGIYPVCNLESYPGLERACGAYGLTAEQLEEQLPIHNPINQLEGLASAKVPIYLLHGDSDEVVPLKANSGTLVEKYHALGGPITLHVVPGGGHTMWEGWFHHQPLVDFVLNYGQSRRR